MNQSKCLKHRQKIRSKCTTKSKKQKKEQTDTFKKNEERLKKNISKKLQSVPEPNLNIHKTVAF